jgi:TPP-dependent pyruvate/acetoin dehydrogenase alpha subunit
LLKAYLQAVDEPEENLAKMERQAKEEVAKAYQKALKAADPAIETLMRHEFTVMNPFC